MNSESFGIFQEQKDRMSYQVLARKWRPKSFDQLVGQQHVVQALVNGLDQDRVHHAFLFTGTRGVGKTTLARIFAKCLNCERGMSSTPCGECASCVDIDEGRFVDIIEIDAASRTKVEDTRELLESVQYAPTRGRYKVYIIDEVHMLSNSSFNALLKTLEEPPPHVKFVLATTDPDKIPVTILSRCLQFNLRRMTPDQVLHNLQHIVQSEGIKAEPEALSRLARAADGSMRDGLSLLDQAIAFGAGQLSLDDVKQMLGLVDHGYIAAIIRALAKNDAHQLLEIIQELVAQSRDLDAVLLSLAETLHRVCLLQCVPDYSDQERSDWDAISELAGLVALEDAQLFYQIAIKGRAELGMAPDPRTGLEMTLLRMLAFKPASDHVEQQNPVPAATPANTPTNAPAGKRSGAAAAAAKAAQMLDREQGSLPHQGTGPGNVGGSLAADKRPGREQGSPLQPGAGPGNVGGSFAADECPSREQGSLPQGSLPQAEVAGLTADSWLILVETLDITGPVRELARNLQLKSAQKGRWEFIIDHDLRDLASRESLERLRRVIAENIGGDLELRVSDSGSGVLHTVAAIEQSRRRTQLSEA
ncbi:MAG TPA: DNA polymerase III subunit gamma/tau, partial [Xanthomonadales bacterium]|nr:DNA polymerase III subunit gamma/tau [Xanthomonadales bacterium]